MVTEGLQRACLRIANVKALVAILQAIKSPSKDQVCCHTVANTSRLV